jgi:hypothetical protein
LHSLTFAFAYAYPPVHKGQHLPRHWTTMEAKIDGMHVSFNFPAFEPVLMPALMAILMPDPCENKGNVTKHKSSSKNTKRSNSHDSQSDKD